MSLTKPLAAIVLASSAVVASSSFAQEPNDAIGCQHMSKRVANALAANQQSANYKAATDEQTAGRQFCLNGVYSAGIAHYEQALNYLGQQQSKN